MLPERAGRLPHYSRRKTIRRKNESHFRDHSFKLSKIAQNVISGPAQQIISFCDELSNKLFRH